MNYKKIVLNKLIKGVKKHSQEILHLRKQVNSPEANSVVLIHTLLRESFGYKNEDIYAEENLGNKHVDISISMNPNKILLCECKRFNENKKFINAAPKQLGAYCQLKGCEWGIISDGIFWQLYFYDQKNKKVKLVYEANFLDIGEKNITENYCKPFYIFCAEVNPKTRKEILQINEALSRENFLQILHSKACVGFFIKYLKKLPIKKAEKELLVKETLRKHFPLSKGLRPKLSRKNRQKALKKISLDVDRPSIQP